MMRGFSAATSNRAASRTEPESPCGGRAAVNFGRRGALAPVGAEGDFAGLAAGNAVMPRRGLFHRSWLHRRTHLGLEPEAELKHGHTIYEITEGGEVTSDTPRPIMEFHGFDDHVRP